MKRSHLLLLTAAATFALLLVFIGLSRQEPNPVLAAPSVGEDPFEEFLGQTSVILQQAGDISCTLAVTTTDSLNNINACPVETDPNVCAQNAVPLADYGNLALVADGAPGDELPVHRDWFRLDNAVVGGAYTVEAIPNRTVNYNLGIIVYDANLNPILSDEDPVESNRARVVLQAETQGPYFFEVFQITPVCTGGTYDLDAAFAAPTPTPTVAAPVPPDEYEPNDTFEQAPTLPIQVPITLDLTFHTPDDVDFFQFYTRSNRWYQAITSDLVGVDTVLEIYDRDRTRIARDTDSGGGFASLVSWQSQYDGYYYVVVRNNVPSVGSYELTLTEIAAPTPGPTPTPRPLRALADDCEPNPDFEHACIIPLDQDLTFNFVPPFGEGPNNDFFKVWVKPGLHYRCATSDLDPGVDPNMIMFRGPSWDDAIGGNDDISPCNLNAAFSFFSDYAGWLYILIGYGDRTPPDLANSNYTLRCEKSITPFPPIGTPRPTATPHPSVKLPTPQPTPTVTPTPPDSPVPTPTPNSMALSVRPLATPPPVANPAPRFVPINLLVYYDANDNRRADTGEGIAGLSVLAYDVATNDLLAQDFTDGRGNLAFTVAAKGPVRVAIPFLGFSRLISEDEADTQVRIPPQASMGGTP